MASGSTCSTPTSCSACFNVCIRMANIQGPALASRSRIASCFAMAAASGRRANPGKVRLSALRFLLQAEEPPNAPLGLTSHEQDRIAMTFRHEHLVRINDPTLAGTHWLTRAQLWNGLRHTVLMPQTMDPSIDHVNVREVSASV